MAEEHRLRTKKLQVFLSKEEYEFLKDKAHYCDTNLSEYIRGIINNGAIIKYAACDIQAAIAELNRVGNNINQIARTVNATGEFLEQDFEQLHMAYEDLFEFYITKMVGTQL